MKTNKSCAIGGRTTRCGCKFRYILNRILQRHSEVSPPQHGFLVYISDHSNAEIAHSSLRWFSRSWRKITAIAENHGTGPKSLCSWIRDYFTALINITKSVYAYLHFARIWFWTNFSRSDSSDWSDVWFWT